jgi:hypothetical protein
VPKSIGIQVLIKVSLELHVPNSSNLINFLRWKAKTKLGDPRKGIFFGSLMLCFGCEKK